MYFFFRTGPGLGYGGGDLVLQLRVWGGYVGVFLS